MTKTAAMFVSAAMAVTAGCVSVIASQGLGLGFSESLLAGVAALAIMAVTHLAFVRATPQADPRIDDIDSLVTDLQSRLETAEARLAMLDGATAERARAATRPLVDEIAALGGLVTMIAKEVAGHDVSLAKLNSAARSAPAEGASGAAPAVAPEPAPAVPEPSVPAPAAEAPVRESVQAKTQTAAPEPARAARLQPPPEPFDPDALEPAADGREGDVRGRFERALREGRIDAYLQPIVALPSRRATHYEALARLIERDGVLAAEDFWAAASGRVADVDRRTLERAASIAPRLAAHGGGAVFVNVAPETLREPAALLATLDLQADMARLIVIEFRQQAFARLGADERKALDGLVERGLRLSIDEADDIRLDPRELTRQGVRFVKVRAARLLDPDAARGAAIHPADLAGLLARHGVELIATHVEEERTVPELLDMEVRLAQGFLFGVPRPVRPAVGAERPAPAAATRLVPRAAASR